MSRPKRFLDGRVTLRAGDCLKVLAQLPDNSVDTVLTDPPYHLKSIVERFGKAGSAPAKSGKSGVFARASAGFNGETWDGGDIAFRVETWRHMLRVLKPGGYLLAFASTKGFGRMSVAIEDAGFITHPLIIWMFGGGMPKATRIVADGYEGQRYGGQSLKPAVEPIYMGQKPFSEGSGTENIQLWGTGAVNIDACRVPTTDTLRAGAGKLWSHIRYGREPQDNHRSGYVAAPGGRWPANLIHDGSPEVLEAFPATAGANSPVTGNEPSAAKGGLWGKRARTPGAFYDDDGSAARFYYCAKATAEDRVLSKHPTVKPLELMQYLARLATPPGGLILDPFAGSGTTGEAAFREGFRALLIEREPKYRLDIERRMLLANDPLKRAAVVAAATLDLMGAEGTPLFTTTKEAAE